MASNKITFSLKNNIPRIRKQLEGEFEQALLKATMRVHREVSTVLSGQRSGYMYPVAGTGRVVKKVKTLPNGRKFYYSKLVGARMYQASAPYEAPASRLGHLRASYKYLVKGKGMTAKGYVGSDLEYSHYLEYGTYKMHPRPHLKVAFKNSKQDIYKYFRGLLRE